MKNEHGHLAENAENTEVVSPGRMLKEARQKLGLSQEQVADKLNFRTNLVQDIEVDQWNLSLPEAFNRGYLTNYAKLVNIAQADVLNSYDQLEVARRQSAQMQSFSKGTEKQAEHNLLMWVTYFILAMLVTATVVWWWQSPTKQPKQIVVEVVKALSGANNAAEQTQLPDAKILSDEPNTEPQDTKSSAMTNANVTDDTDSAATLEKVNQSDANTEAENFTQTEPLDTEASTAISELSSGVTANNLQGMNESEVISPSADVVFTFSGDCWVNISDATGEKIAWGVKKSGYIMRISGQPPFDITLGKPELVQINYNAVPVDISGFNAGNIAKFSLPLLP